jgi:RNA polymerase sigma-70 factor (ECF subfamily)
MDKALQQRIVDGDVDAFSSVVDEYSPRVIAYLASRLQDAAAVQDIAQETFISAYQQLDRFQGRANFSTWLIGIARNKMLMHFRSTTQHKNRQEALRADLMVRLTPDLDAAFEDEEARHQIGRLRNCILKLPDTLRELVSARSQEGESVRCIAERLARSSPSITSSLFRAKKSLRVCMSKDS